MVAEEADASGVVDRNIFADILFVKDGCHRRHVLMTEAEVDGREASISRCTKRVGTGALASLSERSRRVQADPKGRQSLTRRNYVRRKISPHRHRTLRSLNRRQKNLPCIRATLNGNNPPYSITAG